MNTDVTEAFSPIFTSPSLWIRIVAYADRVHFRHVAWSSDRNGRKHVRRWSRFLEYPGTCKRMHHDVSASILIGHSI